MTGCAARSGPEPGKKPGGRPPCANRQCSCSSLMVYQLSVSFIFQTQNPRLTREERADLLTMQTNMINTSPVPGHGGRRWCFCGAAYRAPGFSARAQSAERLSSARGALSERAQDLRERIREARGIFPDLLGAVAAAEQWDLHCSGHLAAMPGAAGPGRTGPDARRLLHRGAKPEICPEPRARAVGLVPASTPARRCPCPPFST